MNSPPLAPSELELLCSVFRKHPELSAVTIFGSRAKGTHAPASDVDLALRGNLDEIQAEAIAAELDELALPYRYDVKLYSAIRHAPLREHIDRAGILVYPDAKGQ